VLYPYPIQATANNWLHACLGETLTVIHDSLLAGQAVPAWPDILPAVYRPRLNRRTGLRDRLDAYLAVASALTPDERARVLQAFAQQNQIVDLLSCGSNCEAVTDLPAAIRTPIRNLFSYSFELLGDLGVRDELYYAVYTGTVHHVCAFCGLEYFDAPGAAREALDHYLAESKYPFAAANLRNLVPMGHKCNSKYKLAVDILRSGDGTRRRAFDPYGAAANIQISLSNSQPFAGQDGQIPAWRIDFGQDDQEVNTWAEVFRIRDRYMRDVLDPSFKTWLREFSAWCEILEIDLNTHEQVIAALNRYAGYHEEGGWTDRSFLKAALFRMLLHHCREGNERLSLLLRDLSG
jgi:hypothetical protein